MVVTLFSCITGYTILGCDLVESPLEHIKIMGTCMRLPDGSGALGRGRRAEDASIRIMWRISRRADSKQAYFKNIAQMEGSLCVGRG